MRDPIEAETTEAMKRMRHAVSSDGRSYSELRKTWRPSFRVVYRDLAFGFVTLAASAIAMVWAHAALGFGAYALVPFGAVGIGGALHHLLLFLHEASHYNLATDRGMNDRIANTLLAPWLGHGIADYRRIHFDHHRHLGTPEDPEHSYFEALTLSYLIRSLTGVRLLQIFWLRFRSGAEPGRADLRGGIRWAALAAVLHGGIILGGLVTGEIPLAIAWAGGVLVVFPFLASVRQTLEHRSVHARADVDYSRVPHGETNRIFRDGLLTSLIGGAGFSRHLLHHWDAQLSYTRLPDLEAFLLDTDLSETIRAHQTDYPGVFRALFGRSA